MKTANIGTHVVEYYDNIDDLPIRRFHEYNKMLLIDSGLGSDVGDFDAHIEKALVYLKSNDRDLAMQELQNMRQTVYFIHSELSPRHLAFAALVKSIDGQPCDDLSQDGFQRVVERLSDAPVGDLAAQIEAVKKKIDDELRVVFPRIFDTADTKQYYDDLRRRTLAILDGIIEGNLPDREAEIEAITVELMRYNKPQKFEGSESLEIAYNRQFDNMCQMLSQHLNVDPKAYTVREYYNAFELLQQQTKQRAKAERGNKAKFRR